MKILIIPLVAAFIAQISKIFIKQNHQKLSWSILWAYSGMPSGHATITSALTYSDNNCSRCSKTERTRTSNNENSYKTDQTERKRISYRHKPVPRDRPDK